MQSASGSGDFDTAETMLTEDFFIREAQGLPMAGEYHGRTALRNLYAQVFGTLKVADLEQECITAGGGCVGGRLGPGRWPLVRAPPAVACKHVRPDPEEQEALEHLRVQWRFWEVLVRDCSVLRVTNEIPEHATNEVCLIRGDRWQTLGIIGLIGG